MKVKRDGETGNSSSKTTNGDRQLESLSSSQITPPGRSSIPGSVATLGLAISLGTVGLLVGGEAHAYSDRPTPNAFSQSFPASGHGSGTLPEWESGYTSWPSLDPVFFSPQPLGQGMTRVLQEKISINPSGAIDPPGDSASFSLSIENPDLWGSAVADDGPQTLEKPELASVLEPSSEQASAIHRVQKDETLGAIAHDYGVTAEAIVTANRLHNPDLLQVGQQIRIPYSQTGLEQQQPRRSKLMVRGMDVHVEQLRSQLGQMRRDYRFSKNRETEITRAQGNANRKGHPGDSAPILLDPSRGIGGPSLAVAPVEVEGHNRFLEPGIGETVEPELPPLSSPEEHLPDSPEEFNGYIWPTRGVLTSGYGWRWGRMHRGIDIAAAIGTPIMAAGSGQVLSAGWNSGGYGNLVKLKHPDGSVTLYAHNTKIFVRKGQRVRQGQQIATMGSTGRSTGPHLHFEIHPQGQGAVNPMAYLPKRR